MVLRPKTRGKYRYIVFVNRQWGAEKKNQAMWFGDRHIGANLDCVPSFAAVAQSLGVEGIRVNKVEEVPGAFREAIRLQMEERKQPHDLTASLLSST